MLFQLLHTMTLRSGQDVIFVPLYNENLRRSKRRNTAPAGNSSAGPWVQVKGERDKAHQGALETTDGGLELHIRLHGRRGDRVRHSGVTEYTCRGPTPST